MKKKIILLFLLLILLPIKTHAISAQAAILIDGDSGRILYAKNENEKKLIASTTKIMSAIIAIENGNLDDSVTIDNSILKAYGSAIYIEIGEELKLRDLLYGLMLRSGNDAAIAIANYISNNQQDFVKLMNNKAEQLNMNNTIFYNPHGLEENDNTGNLSTAYDMAILMKYAMNNKEFQKITATKKYTVKTNKKTYIWYNKNKLLNNYKYTTGGKTGFTKKARRTLVTSASKDNKKLIAVTLNDPNDFVDHQQLYEEYFNKYNLVTLYKKDSEIKDKKYDEYILYIKDDFNMLLTQEEQKKLKLEFTINENNKFNNSNIAGYISAILDKKVIATKNIYYKKKITHNKKNTFIDKIKSWFY